VTIPAPPLATPRKRDERIGDEPSRVHKNGSAGEPRCGFWTVSGRFQGLKIWS
jgi:hypothetical protein